MFDAQRDVTVTGGRLRPTRRVSRIRARGNGPLYQKILNCLDRGAWTESRAVAARIGVVTGEVTKRIHVLMRLGEVETRLPGKCLQARLSPHGMGADRTLNAGQRALLNALDERWRAVADLARELGRQPGDVLRSARRAGMRGRVVLLRAGEAREHEHLGYRCNSWLIRKAD